MILEQQVTSLEISKRLKQLGVRQDSYFYWINELDEIIEGWHLTDEDYWQEHEDEHGSGRLFSEYSKYSAFSVAENMDRLKFLGGYLEITYWKQGWRFYDKLNGGVYEDNNPANASAKMLIHLLENKLITL